MVSNYTCRACLSALTKRSPLSPSAHRIPRKTSVYNPQTSLRYLSATSRQKVGQPAPKPDTPAEESSATGTSAVERIAQELRKRASGTTETYVAYGVTEKLYKECLRHVNYAIPEEMKKDGQAPKNAAGEDVGQGTGWWFETLGLTPTLNTWAQITFIHMYLLTVRFRLFPADHQAPWHQHLINHFFYDAEDRMVMYHGMHARGIRSKYLKDLFEQWRGMLLAYDEGLVRGDAYWAAAIWRNIFKADENADPKAIAEIVGWMRKEIQRLDRAIDAQVANGEWRFAGSPGDERATVMLQSKLMKEGT